ncbi:MAG: fliD [Rhodoferax sp.]|nr:fliD [Rhodoferax sp.]
MADITPSTTATQLATAYTTAAQNLLTNQGKTAQATAAALTKLKTALSAFDTAVSALSGKTGLAQRSATLSGSAGTATATSTAQPGNYTLFVEKLATTHQVAFEDLPAVPVALGGPLVVKLADGSSFTVALSSADQDGNGSISQAEIARAINLESGNQGKVTAMTVTSGGKTQLVLSAGQSGEGGQITLDASGMPASALKDKFTAAGNVLVAAQDAVIWLGGQGGIEIKQASNTLTAIDGVTVNFTQAMATGAAPLTLTIGADDTGTAANVTGFITAYNTLEKALDEMTTVGKDGAAAGAFVSDSGVRSLRTRLNTVLRQSVGSLRLADFGVTADRDGALTLDAAKLKKTLAANPEGLDTLFGKSSLTASSGVLGAFHTLTKSWTDSSSGQIKRRQDTVQITQKNLSTRQDRLDAQYTSAYNRYLAQFTQLQALQSRMSDTSGLFANLGT